MEVSAVEVVAAEQELELVEVAEVWVEEWEEWVEVAAREE